MLFADNEKSLILHKASTPVVIDGTIDPVWSTADSVSDFVQLTPYPGTTSSKKTIAKVLTTEDALYCLMICYDSEENIQQYTGKLDDFGGDIVSIMLDTYGDKQTAYKLAVTAAGVRADCRLLDDARNRDYNWDGVWFSDAKVYEWGFVIEMEIPYRSIQYNDKLTEWGLDFDRYIPSSTEDIYWNEYEKSVGQRISKFGKLIFKEFQPSVQGLNLEIYPVGIAKHTYISNDVTKDKLDPEAGIDIFYNPSKSLTFQLTANPDFAQIEADPFNFNISRYESYFNERRPFFTQGNEVFMPAGKDRNSGFYKPLELFYSRRIGKKLPDGSEVPLQVGTKAFGRVDDWEYGGFLALTGEKDFDNFGVQSTEERAYFASARLKKQIMGNSTIGMLFVGKHTATDDYGVLDIDGAFRSSTWQLAYQLARSFKNSEGGLAVSAGFTQFSETWMSLIRSRYIGKDFDVRQIGYVPWTGTSQFSALMGPQWFFEEGELSQISSWIGPLISDERADDYTDVGVAGGYNMQFRSNWGYEINLNLVKRKDADTVYIGYNAELFSWFNISPKWNGSLWGGYTKTYNFSRGYLSHYAWYGVDLTWKTTDVVELGTSLNSFIEGSKDNSIEEITYNSRPYVSVTPLNDLNVRLYFDNTFVKSLDRFDNIVFGALFSYSFLPKSWIYLAYNEIAERTPEFDLSGNQLPVRIHPTNAVSVLKIKYLYYL